MKTKTPPKQASFKCSHEDRALISKIVERAIKRDRTIDAMALNMDITACHANGNPLRLASLLTADEFNFWHDVGGISRHINCVTGQLENCFSPRFSRPTTGIENQ